MASLAPIRRNDPCPCGSARRYKDCHGKLEGAAAPTIDARIEQALRAHQQGRLEEAGSAYRAILEAEPGNAIATHYLGMIAWSRGELATAEANLRASIAANATIPDFHNNLALLLGQAGRGTEAIAGFRKALEVDPGWYEAHSNLGLAYEAGLRWDDAEAAYRSALALAPMYAAARQNLARLLLSLGRFEEGWAQYRWRLAARGLAATAPDPLATPLPQDLAGRHIVLLAEQGIGDVLFFLRFAPELTRRGAALAFRGDARLHAMLERTGHFALGCADEREPAPGVEAVYVGDLPWLLQANEAATLPPALPLRPLPERVAAMRSRLEAAGPAPRVALTWRSGVESPGGPALTQVKQPGVETLVAMLGGEHATWIGIQRRPAEGSREAVEAALGAPVHDFSAANEDLEDMLALLDLVDDYAGPSNANTHLRAGLGKGQRVFVPNPPEWRWLVRGEASPWFRAMRITRPAG